MLTIFCPDTYQPEREYICHVIFNEFLGLEYTITYSDQKFWSIEVDNQATIVLPDILFQTPNANWLTPKSLPTQPLPVWDTQKENIDCPLVVPTIPIIYGDPEFPKTFSSVYEKQKPKNEKRSFTLPIDIFGSAFFMLTRYEEVVKPDRDNHDRFPATASLAFQEGFLDRPIINEYIEILWFYLQQIMNNGQRTTRNFKIVPTHDVDTPYRFRFTNPWAVCKTLAGDLIKRKNPVLFWKNVINIAIRRQDPFDTFELIMDLSERANLTSSFYFMAGGQTPYDPGYPMKHPRMRGIIKSIHDRGHHVGFHPSYAASLDRTIWKAELNSLRKAVGDIPLCGGREHYLRFQIPETWRFWGESEMPYDSTLSFADMAGFRCGICYPFTVFDVEKRKLLDVIERPLIMMECTVIDERYMNLGATEEAIQYMQILKERCQMVNGDYVVLWHNTRLVNDVEISLYTKLIEA
jgi:hypothetical protein